MSAEAMKRITAGGGVKADEVDKTIEQYNELHSKHDVETRTKENFWMVHKFYDMVTDFYEWGWGASFHFAPRANSESFKASQARHQHLIALKLGLKPGMHVLDLGCGVGGPAREIARFSGARITGCNINEYQLMRLAEEAKRQKLDHLVDGRIADYNHLPFPDCSYDGAYQIEAFCHSTDLKKTYAEAFRVLKPGAIFAGFEWVLTDKYDDNNEIHRALKKGIEEGNGLADMFKQDFVVEAMRSAGFEILEARDVGVGQDRPWYNSLGTNFTIGEGFFYSAWGRWSTGKLVKCLEYLHIAPKGATKVNEMLMKTADALVASGRLGIFNPCFLLVGRKPASSSSGAAAASQ